MDVCLIAAQCRLSGTWLLELLEIFDLFCYVASNSRRHTQASSTATCSTTSRSRWTSADPVASAPAGTRRPRRTSGVISAAASAVSA
jgi:hypothetical protein